MSVQAAAVDLRVKQQPVLRIFIARYYFALHVDCKLENDAQFEAGHGIPKRPLMRGFRSLWRKAVEERLLFAQAVQEETGEGCMAIRIALRKGQLDEVLAKAGDIYV